MGAERLLFRRLFLGRRVLASLAIPFTIGVVFMATTWVANGFALSGHQIAARELGRYDHGVALDVQPGDLTPSSVADVRKALRQVGVRAPSIGVVSTDVRPDQVGVNATAGPVRVLSFTESASPGSDFPSRYALAAGRWPQKPGEVVLSPSLRVKLPGDTFTAFGGLTTFKTVGVFTDRFATGATAILAAAGTWETIPVKVSRAFAPQGALRVMWTGTTSASTVDSATRAALTLAPPPAGNRPAISRSQLIAVNDQSLSDRQRLLFAYPLWVLSAMAGVAVARSNRRWTQAYARRFRDLGLPPRRVGLTLAGVVASGVMIAAGAGLAVGALAGWGVRAWLLPQVLTQPVGPLRSPVAVFAAALIMAGLTLFASASGSVGSGGRVGRWAPLMAQVPWSVIRRVLAALAVVRSIQIATRPDVPFDDLSGPGVLTMLAAVLIAPDLVRVCCFALPRSRPRPLVARRMIGADRGGLALVSIIVAASVAFPITVTSYNASVRRSNDAGFSSMVRPHQVWVDGTSPTMGDPRPVAAAVATVVSTGRAIDLKITNAFVYPVGGKSVENTAIATVPRADDLIGLLGDEPWVHQMAAFVSGGGVAFLDGPTRPIHRLDSDTADAVEVPQMAFEGDSAQYAAPFAAVMLAATATNAGLTRTPLAAVFFDVSSAQTEAAVAAVREAGLDVRLLRFFAATPKTKPSAESYFAVAGLLTVASFLLLGLMRAIGERMRERAAQLLAMGFHARWSASVAALQLGVAVAGGLGAGVLGSVSAVWLYAEAPEQVLTPVISSSVIALTVGLVLAVSVLGVVACVVRVRADPSAEA